MDSNVTEVVFSKKDPKLLTCMGPNFFRLYKLDEGNLSLVRSNIAGLNSDSTRVKLFHNLSTEKLILFPLDFHYPHLA